MKYQNKKKIKDKIQQSLSLKCYKIKKLIKKLITIFEKVN
jgi:hypothetical protein